LNGKVLMSGLILTALAIGGGIWYSSTIGSYDRIDGVERLSVEGQFLPIADYQGLDGVSSPLKLRGCFTHDWDVAPSKDLRAIATPLISPNWFDCFDAEQIDADIQSGAAEVLISTENEPFGFTTYIASYDDGRGYLWRQINDCGTAQFSGEPLPQGCPGAEMPEDAVMAQSISGFYEDVMPVEGSLRGSGPFACFETPLSQSLLSETFVLLDTDLTVPANVPACFPDTLEADAENGAAFALIGAEENQFIAIYPDGRGYVWVAE